MKQWIRPLLATATGTLMLLSSMPVPPVQAAKPPQPTAGAGNPCAPGAPMRTFKIHAIEVDTVYNKYGLHDPSGRMYVLAENRAKVLEQVADNPGKTVSLVEPLTIRTNVGECVDITFVNETDQYASLHPTGVSYDVLGSDGGSAGWNPDTAAGPGNTIQYRWYPEKEGAFFFDNGADQTYNTDPAGRKGSRAHGLFGALIVEPAGATWTDPKTGDPLLSGVKSSVHLPNAPDFRENVIFYHDGNELLLQDGSAPIEMNGEKAHHYTMNYRGDPDHLRYREDCPDCAQDSQFYSSWVHGDPGGGDLVFPVYQGDPVKFHIIGAQVEETHVHHLHNHRWKAQPNDPDTNTLDSQTIGPGETFTEDLTGGAGYKHGGTGDILFHCHLFPHYFDGMWGVMRVHDKVRPDLKPLPDRNTLAEPTAASPGYPNFIAGQSGQRAPLPPDPVLRPPTALEQTALRAQLPGAPYVDPCPTGTTLRQYSVVAMQLRVDLNKSGDNVANARIFVPAADEQAVRSGAKKAEPLVLRANKGDCVEVTLENHFPAADEPNEVGIHIHYVGFDALGSDGATVGYNYDQGIRPGGKIRYRWYPDEEGTIFFHDHQSHSATRGAYGMLAVEPAGSSWLNPANLAQKVTTGTRAVIQPPVGQAFREYSLFYGDQAPGRDKTGALLNPPPVPGSTADQGVSTINYKNAPFYRRTKGDPAHVFSSFVHFDPDTPILEAYPNEPVKIRLVQGSNEELHNFSMHGLSWQRDPHNGDTAAQTISVSEYFDFNLSAGPNGAPERDYLYGSMITDDLWHGMWGSFRVWGLRIPSLAPLPDKPLPLLGVSPLQLAKFLLASGKTVFKGDSVNPCPVGAPEKAYEVVAFKQDIKYNSYGDHDPNGIIFALAEDEAAIRSGAKALEPLVLRANKGDCIVTRLTNKLPTSMLREPDGPEVPLDSALWENSSRISLHPQMVKYDVNTADGAAVGWNFDTTVGSGQTKIYRWHAAGADEMGTTSVLWDMADPRSHRHHGAYGILVIEPEGATYRNPKTGAPIKSGATADILLPGGKSFREIALAFADGAYIVNPDGECVLPVTADGDPTKPCNQQGDPENQGFRGVNYRSEPFARRLPKAEEHPCTEALDSRVLLVSPERIWYRADRCGAGDQQRLRALSTRDGGDIRDNPVVFSRAIPDKHLVFSSHMYGDPNTPIFRAYAGDPVRIRVADTGDKARGISFHLAGHSWHATSNPNSRDVGVVGGFTPGVVANIVPDGGAGGPRLKAGDYLYQDHKLGGYLESGLWGTFQVLANQIPDLLPLPAR